MRQSEESATRNGIQALEMAFSGITRCAQDVESTRMTLSSHYQGADGGSFQSLVKAWEDQAAVILKNVEDMIDKLNETLRENGLQQGASNETIERTYQESQAVFDSLVG
ncbi:hypothetical protein [Streptomyces fumanus]|uniref:Uncharacterized protein n=1 Tax=Streptomyces fumanus TaxID=67302 RepID=A0A919B1V4_9ACTN|nr:hypothetical protein [Streptomyces fumanus]GHF35385.1 hypothetical protein GCM10018772_70920 [Streptomyces fumanus]